MLRDLTRRFLKSAGRAHVCRLLVALGHEMVWDVLEHLAIQSRFQGLLPKRSLRVLGSARLCLVALWSH